MLDSEVTEIIQQSIEEIIAHIHIQVNVWKL